MPSLSINLINTLKRTMAKMMFWAGYFPPEEDFEKYMDQTAFYQWWKEHDEDNLELRCQFCKELGIASYDEDFLIMKYLEESSDIQDFIDYVPAKNDLIRAEVARIGLKQANALICYDKGKDIPMTLVENPTSMSYLGLFNYSTKEIMSRFSTIGMKFSMFVGTITQTKEEFMEYFNQDAYMEELRRYENGETKKKPNPDLRCQFCKDLGITHYYPEFLKIKFTGEEVDAASLLSEVVIEENIIDIIPHLLKKVQVVAANCAFCYIANGFRNKKLDQFINIHKKNTPSEWGRKKGAIDELDNYNGLKFIGSYSWE